MFFRFEFEAAFYPDLRRVPFHVRMKLDLVGIRVSLNTWCVLSLVERRVLCELPVETDEEKEVFATFLSALAESRAGVGAERCLPLDAGEWATTVPKAVVQRSEVASVPVVPAEWSRWASHERYVLYKTALSKDPELFQQALKEMRQRLIS